MRMVNRDKIRRFFILFALLGVVVLLVGPGVRWERFGLSGSVRVAPGLYLVDSRNVSRLEGLPGVAVGEGVAGKRLVRITSSVSLPSPIKVQPYPKETRLAPELKMDGDKRPDPLVVNVTLFSPDEKKKVAAAVAAAGGAVLRGLDEEDAATLRVKVPRAAVRELAAEKGVVWIEPYAPRRFLVDRAAAVTGTAPLLSPGFVTAAGLSGSGQMVGVADNGLDKGSLDDLHPDFGSTPGQMPKVVMLRSWVGGGARGPNRARDARCWDHRRDRGRLRRALPGHRAGEQHLFPGDRQRARGTGPAGGSNFAFPTGLQRWRAGPRRRLGRWQERLYSCGGPDRSFLLL